MQGYQGKRLRTIGWNWSQTRRFRCHSDYARTLRPYPWCGCFSAEIWMDLYANEATWKAMEGTKYLGKVDDAQKAYLWNGQDQDFRILILRALALVTMLQPLNFIAWWRMGRALSCWRIRAMSDRLAGIVADADGYLIESNHDVEILRAGSYAWRLKQRILSDLGHLSNEDGADAMIRTLGNRTKKIYLGHLSKREQYQRISPYDHGESTGSSRSSCWPWFWGARYLARYRDPFDEDIRWKTTCGWFLYAYLRKSTSSNEFALYPKNSCMIGVLYLINKLTEKC